MSRDADEIWFRSFVDTVRWRFARTYVESYPHEYTLDEWCDDDAFDKAIVCIERWGVVEPFFTSRRKYFYVDERKYWHMGDVSSENPEEQPQLINRSWAEVARYREEAEKLGYEGARIEALVERWKTLLTRAKHAE